MKICVVRPGTRLERARRSAACSRSVRIILLSLAGPDPRSRTPRTLRAGALACWRGRVRCADPGVAANKFRDGADHRFLLRSGQLAVNRQREARLSGALGVRKVAAPVAQVGEARLEVER